MAVSQEKCAEKVLLERNGNTVSTDRSLKSLHEQLMKEIIKG